MAARALVLAYHAVADLSDDPVLEQFGTPRARFVAQLDALRRRYSIIGLDELLAAFDGGPRLPPRPVLLTFDDAYADFAEAALPALRERSIPTVLFAVAGLLGGTNEWDRARGARTLDLLDADALAATRSAGVEVGAHSVSHPALTTLGDEELRAEVRGSADRLEASGLPRPRAFAFPYGDHDPRVVEAARDAGYAIAFTTEPRVAGAAPDRHAFPRVQVLASDSGWRFGLRLAAASWPLPAHRVAYRLLRPATRGRA